MSDEVLRLRGVEVRRDAAVLLRNVDWTAHEDERWILIGPNGAGKTTLLQVAATTIFPSQGTVEVLGEHLGEVDLFDLRPRIGLTSAAIAEQVPPSEKVIDLVLTASYGILGRWKEDYDSADVTRAVELLDALGCAHLIRRKFATLSEGERKRVQIARALMPDPELLLLDEPAAGLDLGGREDLLRRLASLARNPKAPMMVLVTHHVEEVPDGFTHAMLLRRGSVLAAGPIDGVFTARNLSRCFGVQLEIEHRQSRWTARARLARGVWGDGSPQERGGLGGSSPRGNTAHWLNALAVCNVKSRPGNLPPGAEWSRHEHCGPDHSAGRVRRSRGLGRRPVRPHRAAGQGGHRGAVRSVSPHAVPGPERGDPGRRSGAAPAG
jgi:iron complex transport system ATP-binding protein